MPNAKSFCIRNDRVLGENLFYFPLFIELNLFAVGLGFRNDNLAHGLCEDRPDGWGLLRWLHVANECGHLMCVYHP